MSMYFLELWIQNLFAFSLLFLYLEWSAFYVCLKSSAGGKKKKVLQGFKSSGAKQAAAHFMIVKSDRYWKKSLNLSTGYNHQNIPM